MGKKGTLRLQFIILHSSWFFFKYGREIRSFPHQRRGKKSWAKIKKREGISPSHVVLSEIANRRWEKLVELPATPTVLLMSLLAAERREGEAKRGSLHKSWRFVTTFRSRKPQGCIHEIESSFPISQKKKKKVYFSLEKTNGFCKKYI